MLLQVQHSFINSGQGATRKSWNRPELFVTLFGCLEAQSYHFVQFVCPICIRSNSRCQISATLPNYHHDDAQAKRVQGRFCAGPWP